MPILKTIAGALIGDAIGKRRGNGLVGAGVGIVATRLATRSIPGALLVGGAFVAKKLYDKRKEKRLSGTPASKQIVGPSDSTL
jgi:hypothetical protein